MSLGGAVAKPDAYGKVTGEAIYAGDIADAEMLHAKVLFTDQVHARITALDATAAEAMPGVHLVLTAADVPVNEYGLTKFDQPVLVGPQSVGPQSVGPQSVGPQSVGPQSVGPQSVGPQSTGRAAVAADVSRWEADHLAVVVADTADIALAAAQLIVAEWEPLDVVADLDAALKPDATLVHPEDGIGSNVYAHLKIRKGDTAAAFADAAHIVEGTYEYPYQEHAYLQTEVAVSYIDDEGRVTVETAGQWTHEDQEQVAHALDLTVERVRVIYRAIGGAFGGKEDMSLQIVMALAAQRLYSGGVAGPVRCEWSREESIVGHHKRHRGTVHTRWAADADGRILGVEADGYLDAGAYNYTSNKVLGNLHLTVSGAYVVPNACIDSRAVYTNAPPGGAFRGFGGPQGTFVAEMQMNKLAALTGIDPVEIRRRNILAEGSVGITDTEMPAGVSLGEVVEACANTADWSGPRPGPRPVSAFATLAPSTKALRRGRGFACAYKNIGFSFGFPERSEAAIVLRGDGPPAGEDLPSSAELYLAGADVGQGAHTAFLQMAAEATGLPFEAIEARFSDTATSGDSGSASASRLTWMTGNAILGAAEEAAKSWLDGDRPAIGEFRYVPPPTEPLDPDGVAPTTPNFAYGYVAEAVDLSVDIETGHIVVHDVVCAIDVGRVVNHALVVGQVEGAVIQAHGYALSENLQVVDGRILNPRFSGYLIPGIEDIPQQVRSVLLEIPDPRGPFGLRGMAEMPFLPYTPAIAAALHDATGVWFNSFPLTPARVLAGLSSDLNSRLSSVP